MKHVGQHAIVIGASMGGMLAARALSDSYAVVTVLERDALPRLDIPRKGVRRAATRMACWRAAEPSSRISFPAGPAGSLPAAASWATLLAM